MNIDVNGDNNRVAGRDYIELRIYCAHCETANTAPLALIKRAVTQLATAEFSAVNDSAILRRQSGSRAKAANDELTDMEIRE